MAPEDVMVAIGRPGQPVWSGRTTCERRNALVAVCCVAARLLGPKGRASVACSEVRAHERQSAVSNLRVKVAGGTVQCRGEIPGVYGELGALPVNAGLWGRPVVVVPTLDQISCVRTECTDRIVASWWSRGRPVDCFAANHPAELCRCRNDMVNEIPHGPLVAGCLVGHDSQLDTAQQITELVGCAAEHRQIFLGPHGPETIFAESDSGGVPEFRGASVGVRGHQATFIS